MWIERGKEMITLEICDLMYEKLGLAMYANHGEVMLELERDKQCQNLPKNN